MILKTKSFVLIFLLSYSANATLIFSVSDGYWQNTFTWSTNSIPASGDTVFIHHLVRSDVPLSVNNINITIDSIATLCCLNNLDLNNYTYVLNYGKIKASHFFIHSYAHLENNGYFDVFGGQMLVYDNGSVDNNLGSGIVHIGLGACCISSTSFYDNSSNKFSYEIIHNTSFKLRVEKNTALNYEWFFTNGTAEGTNVQHIFSLLSFSNRYFG